MKTTHKILTGLGAILVTGAAALAVTLSYSSACSPAPATATAGAGDLMQAIVYRCYGGPEVLQLEQVARPEPAATEVLVQVHTASVNPLDWHYMRGAPYIMRLMSGLGAPADPRMGVDFAGTVAAVGSSVTRFDVGDRVFGGRNGAFAEYLVIPQDRALAKIPDTVNFEEAGAVGVAAVTALQALRDQGGLQAGQKVLVNGASGGVGTFAVQIAKSMGAEVTGVCSTRNVAMVRSIGADHVIDYTREDFTQGGARYDFILDNVGNRSLSEIRRVLTPDGRVQPNGGGHHAGRWFGSLGSVVSNGIRSRFDRQLLGPFLSTNNAEDLVVLRELAEAGKIRPVIDKTYPLADVAQALGYVGEGHASGTMVLTVPGASLPGQSLSASPG